MLPQPVFRARFYWDHENDESHFAKHGVTEEEVIAVLKAPGEDRVGAEGARITIGQTLAGRYLKVVYVRDPQPGSVFVITAYDLTGNALLAYRRRRRKK